MTLLLLLFHEYFPKRIINLHPELTQAFDENIDTRVGGNSKLIWIDKKNTHWLCDMKEGAPYQYCSVSVLWSKQAPYRQVDFSKFTHLEVDLEYTGNARYLRVFARNFYPASHMKLEDSVLYSKFNTISKRANKFENKLNIPLVKMRVADWWIEEFNIPPEDIHVDLSKTITVGIDQPYPVVLGKHEFKLKSLTVVGNYFSRETLYFAIIIFWAILLPSEMFLSYLKLRKNAKQNAILVSELSAKSAVYKEKAETDKLTGVLNREGLEQIVSELESRRLLFQHAMLVLDLDHFKKVNDEHGHVIGDQVLQEAAEVIRRCMRSYDTIARWGGEEFILLFHCSDQSKVLPFAEKIRKTVANHRFSNGKLSQITVSIGAVHLSKNETFRQSFIRADRALYEAKKNGRNKVLVK